MVFLVLLLSVFIGLDHHICSDHHCMLCNIIRPLTKQFLAVGSRLILPIIAALLLVLWGTISDFVLLGHTPVHQKDKLTC